MPGMDEPSGIVETIAGALHQGAFDPEHAGDLFLRADAERAITAALGAGSEILVAGKDGGRIRSAGFMGARFAPHLVVVAPGGAGIAVTITLLRGDAGPITAMLANALVLSGRYAAVVAFVLDRRIAKRNPFGGDDAAEVRGITDAERAFLDQLWAQHRVRVEVRRQNPFGWD